MIIRNETFSDIEAISDVTITALQNLAISNHKEQFIIADQRKVILAVY
jgi:putative acetyltransferase